MYVVDEMSDRQGLMCAKTNLYSCFWIKLDEWESLPHKNGVVIIFSQTVPCRSLLLSSDEDGTISNSWVKHVDTHRSNGVSLVCFKPKISRRKIAELFYSKIQFINGVDCARRTWPVACRDRYRDSSGLWCLLEYSLSCTFLSLRPKNTQTYSANEPASAEA